MEGRPARKTFPGRIQWQSQSQHMVLFSVGWLLACFVLFFLFFFLNKSKRKKIKSFYPEIQDAVITLKVKMYLKGFVLFLFSVKENLPS